MNKLVMSFVALASLAGAGVAMADQTVGTVEKIEPCHPDHLGRRQSVSISRTIPPR